MLNFSIPCRALTSECEVLTSSLCFAANRNKKEKLQHFRDIVKALPVPNRDTLEFLLRHLLRSVTIMHV
jgi:hypothetical protein